MNKLAENYFGKHIYIKKSWYTHHGIGVGDGKVIHYAGYLGDWEAGPVSVVSLEEFSEGMEIYIRDDDARTYDPMEAVKRAFSRIGEDGYSLWGNNCEHFVEWCISGKHESTQVQKVGFGLLSSAVLLVFAAVASYWYLDTPLDEELPKRRSDN
ncbi:lecithin retinol acyltransferase family protein [Sediminitomix flava]|uniref:Lecithin:retinol acyltransferase n=1 Tax=Sediminitomix flava TaxID=379075 RepID=A0A316A446_SEDFL|nr:lecithin retinol acyltransferase family protein [Sediminitomix flava]PWJ44507.1 lecithin:retinol acyltransferase [Sediminitomix flava]